MVSLGRLTSYTSPPNCAIFLFALSVSQQQRNKPQQQIIPLTRATTTINIIMLSSISSYIWGGEAEAAESATAATITTSSTDDAAASRQPPPREPSPAGGTEDWVLVGPNQPAPGNLSGLAPLPPVTPSPAVSSASSVSGDEAEEEESDVEEEDGERPLEPADSRLPSRAAAETRLSSGQGLMRSAQISRQKNSGKALSSKALKRTNKVIVMWLCVI